MPVKPVKPASDCHLTLVTTGKKSSSFRVIVPAEIVKEMKLGKEERFIIDHDTDKPNMLLLKKVSPEELRTLLE